MNISTTEWHNSNNTSFSSKL